MKFRLKEIRENKGLSQQELAVRCKLALSTVQKYEYESKKQYSHEIIEKFCEALDCEPGDLFVLEKIAA